MRPRRKLLIYAANEEVTGTWRYVLDVHGYRCFSVTSVTDLLGESGRWTDEKNKVSFYDAILLCVLSPEEAKDILGQLTWPRRAVVLSPGIAADDTEKPMKIGVHFLNYTSEPREFVVENLRLAAARRRGPVPGTPSAFLASRHGKSAPAPTEASHG